ncbi:hypothetical protein OC835_000146 [Tilletia horrida]|nr:hypothetical protein OC835_000146 [Tilletia horrida]
MKIRERRGSESRLPPNREAQGRGANTSQAHLRRGGTQPGRQAVGASYGHIFGAEADAETPGAQLDSQLSGTQSGPRHAQQPAAGTQPGSQGSATRRSGRENPHALTEDGRPSNSVVHGLARRVEQLQQQQQELASAVRSLVTDDVESRVRSYGTDAAGPIPEGLTFTPAGGPAAPPVASRHQGVVVRRNFRHLVQERMDHPTRKPWELRWPDDRQPWPTRVIPGRDGRPPREIPLLRLDFYQKYMAPRNQKQLRPVFDHLLQFRQENGVPADMTRERLVVDMRTTFYYWQRQHRLERTTQGQSRSQRERERSVLLARRRTKRKGRTEASGVKRFVRFANGDAVTRMRETIEELRQRRHEMRADVEFGTQMAVHSPEIARTETMANGEERTVTEPLALEWRSAELLQYLHVVQRAVARSRPFPTRPCTRAFPLGPRFRLPSSIRRWMVSGEWAAANPEAVVNVSDNAGPFRDASFVVASSPGAWGTHAPLRAVGDGSQEADYFGDAGHREPPDEEDEEEEDGEEDSGGRGARSDDDDDDDDVHAGEHIVGGGDSDLDNEPLSDEFDDLGLVDRDEDDEDEDEDELDDNDMFRGGDEY